MTDGRGESLLARRSRSSARTPKKKILIVNCFFPDERAPIKRSNQVPNALAPVLLAGYLNDDHCEIKLYNEVYSGFIEVYAPELLEWPDMLVLSSLTAAFDRLLHVTAYARTANPKVVVAAGGHGVRALPTYSQRFFDYACTGDVDQIRDVVAEAFGEAYLAEAFNPRYDLAYWMNRFGYVESSRNCNFRCGFCSLTGVGKRYDVPPLEYLDAQLNNLGKRPIVLFQDNQILGSSAESFRERIELFRSRRDAGQFKYWTGFVTNTFFWEDENIEFARETGCLSLFVGVESFDDSAWLKDANKQQNNRFNQIELIRRAIDGGVMVQYGLVYDPTSQSLEAMHRELEIICDTPEIPAPNFIFTAIPFPGTPFFRKCIENDWIRPNTHVRDLEGSTLSLATDDPREQVIDFVQRGKRFGDYRKRFIAHQWRFIRRYRKALNFDQRLLANLCAAAIMAPSKVLSPGSVFKRKTRRTHLSTTEVLDGVYTPRLPVARELQHYFEPTRITDDGGELNETIADDLLGRREPVDEKVVQYAG